MSATLADRLRRAKPASAEGSTFTADGGPPEGPGRRRRRVRIAALASVVLVAAAAVTVVALSSSSSSHGSQGTGIPPGDTTATVERRTLVEHAQVNGTLGYGSTLELYDRIAGTFTWLPSAGAVIGRGGTLWRINNQPIVLMYGSIPAYRTLAQGVSDGPDVAELNNNLAALGYDPYGAIGDRRHFGEATAAAVRRWQKASGLPETGQVELGRVMFAPGARRVTAVHVALGQDPPGESGSEGGSGSGSGTDSASGSGSGSTNSASNTPSAKHHPSHPAPKRPSSVNKRGRSNSRGSSNGSPAKGSASKESSSHANSSKESAGKEGAGKEGNGREGGGSGGGAPKLTLGTTSTQQIVQLQVKANQQQLARVGEKAPVTLPDGRTVQGHITNVGTVASESGEGKEGSGNGGGGGGGGGNGNSSGNGENATIPVTLALDRPVARLDKAPVSVQLVKSIRRNVLTVPATALVATAGGGYAIQALENGRRIELPVTPGMFANGYVEIEGARVSEGLTALVPR